MRELDKFIAQIRDQSCNERELESVLISFVKNRPDQNHSSELSKILSSIIGAKRYRLLVSFLESVQENRDSHIAFDSYLIARPQDVDSDLDYRMRQLMEVNKYQSGLDLFSKHLRGRNKPLEMTAIIDSCSYLSVNKPIMKSEPDVSSDEKLPFSGRIRTRRIKSNSENQGSDISEVGIDPSLLRSVMLKKTIRHRISAATNEISASLYDATSSISNSDMRQSFVSFENSVIQKRSVVNNLRADHRSSEDAIESSGKLPYAKNGNVRGVGNKCTRSL